MLLVALYLLLRRRALKASWGDVWAGLWGSLARLCLQNLSHDTFNRGKRGQQ